VTGHAHLGGDITDTGRGQGRVPFRLYSFMGGETQTLSLSATYLRGQDVCKAQRDYKNERGRAQRRRVCQLNKVPKHVTADTTRMMTVFKDLQALRQRLKNM